MAKNCYPVILLSVCKIFETLANDRLVDHHKKDFLHLFYFQYDFRSSGSTADLLTVVSDRIARALNRSGATQTVALGISKAFYRISS